MKIDQNAINTAVTLLTEGKLIALPTETVYGLGGDARNEVAIQKIFRVKNRPPTNPLIIHLSSISAIEAFASNIPPAAWVLARAFWPGPLTLILAKHYSVLPSVTAHQSSVAVRIPNHPVALAVLEAFGGGIAAPSANFSGAISPTCAEHVKAGLGSAVDYILDGGPCQIGIESTIVSLLEDFPVILRQGHISAKAIADVLGHSAVLEKSKMNIVVPGTGLKHYAPSKPLYLMTRHEIEEKLRLDDLNHHSKYAVLSYSFGDSTNSWIRLEANASAYAHALYAALHRLDRTDAQSILVETPPLNMSWLAVHDRLQRAAVL